MSLLCAATEDVITMPAAGTTGTRGLADRQELTGRQLEVAMLLRSGLRHGEIAALLSVSQRQVARLAAQARQRASASTSSHLVALLAVADRRMDAGQVAA